MELIKKNWFAPKVEFLKKNWLILTIFATVLLLTVVFPESSYAASSTGQVKSKLNKGILAIQSVCTAIIVAIGVFAGSKIVGKFMPSLDDPHSKQEMWKSLGGVSVAVICGAAIPWILPWLFSLFK
ncbi:CagC family type IV secretion system protein [Bacillus haynesii]|uniref:CagC family type IV secretion system protein n=1 Tax=Bacillus haynesii TaxID=1925021 RepID=UPI0022803080|nr:CagC family type IV secretion system protein [Bacillus haynesii]MCY8737569.1 CagC family type IV secretion system protein [Bacillus haynesii]MEC0709762.1 CagC family type IV secretion system protein [Bacillus haynesii]MEC0736859.1 CagC family type IV secretion system protein [Bacillus haynesii]